MGKLKIKQVRSSINQTGKQKKSLQALGLKKINHIVEVENRPEILGMINKVSHLIEVEESK